MRKRILAFCVYLIFCLAGCSSAIDLPTVTPVAERINTREAQQTGTHRPPAPLVATPTPSRTAAASTLVLATSTPTIPPEARLEIRDVTLFNAFPEEYEGLGYLILKKLDERQYVYFVINLTTLEVSPLAETQLGRLSPDERWLIRFKDFGAQDAEDRIYELVSVQGEIQNTFTLEKDWSLRDTWINNHQILADRRAIPEAPQRLVYETMAINPLTGQTTVLPFDYPDIYDLETMDLYAFNVYDPSLNFVVYPAYVQDFPPGHMLRDVINRKNIVSIPVSFTEEPVWSPSGDMFAVGGILEGGVLGVTLNGEVKKLTHVEAYNGMGVAPQNLRWSPDGQKIAFTMSPSRDPKEDEPHCLAVLAVEEESVRDYCVPGFHILGELFSHNMLWSPDSRRILVQADGVGSDEPDDTHSLLIDLEKEIAIDLGNGMKPVYFISSLPSVWVKKMRGIGYSLSCPFRG